MTEAKRKQGYIEASKIAEEAGDLEGSIELRVAIDDVDPELRDGYREYVLDRAMHVDEEGSENYLPNLVAELFGFSPEKVSIGSYMGKDGILTELTFYVNDYGWEASFAEGGAPAIRRHEGLDADPRKVAEAKAKRAAEEGWAKRKAAMRHDS